MALAGHLTTVKVSGTPVSFTDEATTSLGGNRFQITDVAKRVVDITQAVVVEDGGVPIAVADWSLDGLFGIVTLDNAPGGAVTVTGNSHPLLTIATARETDLTMDADADDSTRFKTQPTRTKQVQLLSASGTLTRLDFGLEDYDPGGGVERIFDWLSNATPKLLEITPGGGSVFFRGWVLFETDSLPTSVEALQQGTASWISSSRDAFTGLDMTANFGWSDLA